MLQIGTAWRNGTEKTCKARYGCFPDKCRENCGANPDSQEEAMPKVAFLISREVQKSYESESYDGIAGAAEVRKHLVG